jgi:hypothetical protein
VPIKWGIIIMVIRAAIAFPNFELSTNGKTILRTAG